MTRLPRECRRIERDLAACIYGDLDARRAATIAGHLDRCDACRVRADALRTAAAALGRWHVAEPTADDQRAIVSALAAAREQAPSWARWAAAAEAYFAPPLRRTAAVALAIVVLSASMVRIGSPRSRQPARPSLSAQLQADMGATQITLAPGPAPWRREDEP
jgi:predicted anti-sigma-YlaC factor YlaD